MAFLGTALVIDTLCEYMFIHEHANYMYMYMYIHTPVGQVAIW